MMAIGGGKRDRTVRRHVSAARALPLVFWALAACSQAPAHGAPSEPAVAEAHSLPAVALAGRVTDEAGILTVEQKQSLDAKLAKFELSTHHQMVVVTVASLNGADVTPFTTKLANDWGIGRKGDDDGVVVLVAPKEQQARIAVGYGLEKALPDILCQAIMQAKMIPRFRDGDLYGGIASGVDALIEQLD